MGQGTMTNEAHASRSIHFRRATAARAAPFGHGDQIGRFVSQGKAEMAVQTLEVVVMTAEFAHPMHGSRTGRKVSQLS